MNKYLCAFAFFIIGCSGSHHEYFLSCYETEDGLEVHVDLPDGYCGLLSIKETGDLHYAVENDTCVFDLPPGTYTVTLKYFPSYDRVPRVEGSESCEVTLGGDENKPEPPVSPCKYMRCTLNYGGFVTVHLSLCDYKFFDLYLENLGEVVVVQQDMILVFQIDLHEKFTLVHGDIVLFECEVTIDDLPYIDPPPPGLPPFKHGHYKYLVCHKGMQKLVPWPAMTNMVANGATLGVCK